MARARLVSALAVGALLCVEAAWAQDAPYGGGQGAAVTKAKDDPPAPPPPQAPSITLPILDRDEGAAYPEQALKDGVREVVTVTVVVVIDPEGNVVDATVPAPQGHGFDEAAIAAAKTLHYKPATKNGQPIRAKFKHAYSFAPPPGRIVGKVAERATNKPIGGVTVTVKKDGVAVASAQTTLAGTFAIPDLVFGNYRLEASASGYLPISADEDLAPGSEISERLRLDADKTTAPIKTAPGQRQDTPAGEVEDVVVRGTRPPREVTKRTLEARELLRIPGSNGDALRALQNLPGVARPPGLAGLLVVRGAAPQDTLIFVDGTPIPLVYHFGGLSSVIPTELLDRIDFYPGNFSAQYGRALGGIVDVAVRAPKSDKLHGLAQVDLIDVRLLAEGPIGAGWSFSVAGRRSWVDTWLKPVLEATGAGVTTAPVYYDYQAVLEKRWSKDQSFRLMFFGSDDRLDVLIKDPNASDPGIAGGISAHTGFFRIQGLYRHRLSPTTEVKLNAAVGSDFVDFTLGDVFFKLTTYPITGRFELTQKVAPGLVANFGMDMLESPYTVSARLPPLPRPGEPPGGPGLSRPPLEINLNSTLYRPGLYTEFEITPFKGTRLVPGVRLDYSKDTKTFDLAPRIVARQDLGPTFPRTTIKAGVGVFYQPPQPQDSLAVFGQKGLLSNRALQYSVGGEREITKYLEISVEGFYKQLDHLVTAGHLNDGRGRVYGLETLIRYKPDAHFFGWIAYTLSRSERQDTPQDAVRLAAFDQTHILTVLGSYRLGGGWEFGARFRLVSGNLFTPSTYGFYDANAGTYLAQRAYPPNGERLPLYHQLDLRVDKTWKFKAWQLGVYLDVQNIYNQGNVEGVSYNYNYTQRSYATGLPILPSLGMRGEF